jgi:hypothetical protein
MSALPPFSAFGANPFLDIKDNKPVSATFRGSEWGDEIEQDKIPLIARVITTRIVKMAWGAIFKIEFVDLKSRAPQSRKIEREYVVVTDSRIALLNEEDVDAAIRRFSALATPPEFEPGEIYGITSGSFDHEDGLWKTTIRLKGDRCIYETNPSLGTFQKSCVEEKRWIS